MEDPDPLYEHDIFHLKHLLRAGTVQIYCTANTYYGTNSAFLNGGSGYADWNSQPPPLLLNESELHLQPTSSSVITVLALAFLVHHQFIRATWKRHHSVIHVRIYLVPFDLPGAGGKLTADKPARTNRSKKAWNEAAPYCDPFEPFLPRETDNRTLSEIYSDLPSPVIDHSTFLLGKDRRTRETYMEALHWTSPPGMRPLYKYQRRTVARMLQQELDPGHAPDPRYVPIHDAQDSSKFFYLQPSTLEILSSIPSYPQARGGILCEEMGSGKTCIMLGLITATRYQLSSPEESELGIPKRPVLTPLSLFHFRSKIFREARKAAHIQHPTGELPSLVELTSDFVTVSPEFLRDSDRENLRDRPHLSDPLEYNQPFYHVYSPAPVKRTQLKAGDQGPRKMYLTTATLIIVPAAILQQWGSEINKHCEDGCLRVLSLHGNKPVPSARELASRYDIVLLTHEKFRGEWKGRDVDSFHSWETCTCPAFWEMSRIPRCSCDVKLQRLVSPLVLVRWKRLVVDEGHGAATSRSNFARLACELSAERRWIMSGTPTTNLMGVSLGLLSDRSDTPKMPSSEVLYDGNPRGESVTSDYDTYAGEAGVVPDSTDVNLENGDLLYPSDASGAEVRRWTTVDNDDLRKVAQMMSEFVKAPPFAGEAKSFKDMVNPALLDKNGPRFGAIRVLTQVMSQVMLRHRIEDIEKELPNLLPPKKEKVVKLKFHPLAAKTYNVLQAGIAVNAVDSQRTDKDYLFHKSNRAALRLALDNLAQTMFWRTDQDIFDICAAVVRSQDAMKKGQERKIPETDLRLLEESLRIQRDAANDELWKDAMRHEECHFVVRGLAPALQAAWFRINPQLFTCNPPLLDAERLCKLREIMISRPLISEESLITCGHRVSEEDRMIDEKFNEIRRVSKSRKKVTDKQEQILNRKLFNHNAGEVKPAIILDSCHAKYRQDVISTIPPVYIGNSVSSKLNYILRKVLKHAHNHKFLIFSALPLSLAYIEDALKLIQIPCLAYTSRVDARARHNAVVTFETSDKYRVLLMELKLGARGLNLVTASRIIFCEPVWQADIEAQAIKRAHRIGQKCSKLKVTTLVMEGTYEEAMVLRRRALRNKSEKMPAMEEDAGLNSFLRNAAFIREEHIVSTDTEPEYLGIPLIPVDPPTSEPLRTLEVRIDVDGGFSGERTLEQLGQPPCKKIKRVHFG
ncbi:SNF2 family N-terminal domain-containing protein [Hysterangium stoloniferum]|nr:SNF2 family N-terminal domain-containing protein [Hysterangium stoloniferum]